MCIFHSYVCVSHPDHVGFLHVARIHLCDWMAACSPSFVEQDHIGQICHVAILFCVCNHFAQITILVPENPLSQMTMLPLHVTTNKKKHVTITWQDLVCAEYFSGVQTVVTAFRFLGCKSG